MLTLVSRAEEDKSVYMTERYISLMIEYMEFSRAIVHERVVKVNVCICVVGDNPGIKNLWRIVGDPCLPRRSSEHINTVET